MVSLNGSVWIHDPHEFPLKVRGAGLPSPPHCLVTSVCLKIALEAKKAPSDIKTRGDFLIPCKALGGP